MVGLGNNVGLNDQTRHIHRSFDCFLHHALTATQGKTRIKAEESEATRLRTYETIRSVHPQNATWFLCRPLITSDCTYF